MTHARILGVAGGDPLDRRTSSGRAAFTLAALERRGSLAGAIAARPDWVGVLEKAGSVSRERERWKQGFFASATRTTPAARAVSEAVGSLRARRPLGGANVLLQVTGWFSLGRLARRAGALHALYVDTTLARFLGRPDLALDPGSRPVARTLAFEGRMFRAADVTFTTSEWARESIVADYGADPDRVIAVGLGANVARAPAMPERDWSIPRLLFVGYAWERKGGPELLEGFRRLRVRHPGAELTIVGPEPREPEPGVAWRGRIDRTTAEGETALAALHERATLFCMPSRYEPLGNAHLEAMSYGLPVVAGANGGAADVIGDGACGRIVPPMDASALGDVLEQLAGDPEGMQRMGAEAVRRARGSHTWDGVAARMADALEERL